MSAVAQPAPRRRRSRRKVAQRVALNLTGLLVFVVMAFPSTGWCRRRSSRASTCSATTPQWIPERPTLANFRRRAGRPHFWDNVRNSLIVVGSGGRRFARARVPRGARAGASSASTATRFVVVIFAVQMVPLVALIIPLFIALSRVGRSTGSRA